MCQAREGGLVDVENTRVNHQIFYMGGDGLCESARVPPESSDRSAQH